MQQILIMVISVAALVWFIKSVPNFLVGRRSRSSWVGKRRRDALVGLGFLIVGGAVVSNLLSGGANSSGTPQTTHQDTQVVTETATLEATASSTLWTTENANLRAEPQSDSSVVTTVPAGQAVLITGAEADGWIPVRFDGHVGFIWNELLADEASQ